MKTPLAVMLLLGSLVSGSQVFADAGVNLSWDACTPEGGVQSKTFACSSNSGSRTIVGSFRLATDQESFVGVEVTLDLQAQSDGLPGWWQFFNVGACRQSALSVNFIFSSDPNTFCTDAWSGQAVGGIAAYYTAQTAGHPAGITSNRARLRIGASVPGSSPLSLTSDTEYYGFKVVINSAKTVGSGSCEGCDVPVCLVLSRLTAVQGDGARQELTEPIMSNVVAWQDGLPCRGPNLPHNVTWGSVRGLIW